MKILCFGRGGLSGAFATSSLGRAEVHQLYKQSADVTDLNEIRDAISHYDPDFVINCAGRSDRHPAGADPETIFAVNALGAVFVGEECRERGIPLLQIGSTAGMRHPFEHPWYGPAKAAAIAYVESVGKAGQVIWCLSPNRMDTPMRRRDWPDEDVATRLSPREHVVPVMWDIIDEKYQPGANVVVRKVGVTDRVDVFEAPLTLYPSMLED